MQIKENLTTVNYSPRDKRDIKFIVIHYTANKNDTAYNNTRYFKDSDRGASAHYFVDGSETWRCVRDRDVAWHCGAKTYRHPSCRNENSLGIELCTSYSADRGYYISADTEQRGLELTRELMGLYGIPAENVVRHYDVTGKNCPAPWVVNESEWNRFKQLLEEDIDMDKLQQLEEELASLKAENDRQNEVISRMGGEIQELKNPMIYNYIDDNMPEWAHEAVGGLVALGILKGDENGELGLTDEGLRLAVMLWRAIGEQ